MGTRVGVFFSFLTKSLSLLDYKGAKVTIDLVDLEHSCLDIGNGILSFRDEGRAVIDLVSHHFKLTGDGNGAHKCMRRMSLSFVLCMRGGETGRQAKRRD